MLIWLQNEFIPKLHVIIIFILIINQERVVVIKLLMKIMEKRKTERTGQTIKQHCGGWGNTLSNKEGTYGQRSFKEDQNEPQTSYYLPMASGQLVAVMCPHDHKEHCLRAI